MKVFCKTLIENNVFLITVYILDFGYWLHIDKNSFHQARAHILYRGHGKYWCPYFCRETHCTRYNLQSVFLNTCYCTLKKFIFSLWGSVFSYHILVWFL